MPITRRTLQLEQRLRSDLAKITDEQTRDLVKAWATAWNEVEADLRDTLLAMLTGGDSVTRAQLLRSTRLQKALRVIASNLRELAQDAGVRITGDLQHVVDTAGAAQASVIDSQLPPQSPHPVDLDAWSRVDARQVTAIVTRSTQQITALSKPLSGEAYDAVRREIIRGVASGANPRQTARRMIARAEAGFNGGLTRALTIARTETLDAHRAAAALGQVPHTDVLAGWTWIASLSSRTCPACFAMHGTEHPLDEPGPLGHQQCRCTRLPRTKTWTELGFRGVTEPPSAVPDAGEYFAGLSTADQVAILGVSGHAAWAAGRFPMQAWATRRATPGWRDSYVVARPPRQSGGRRAA